MDDDESQYAKTVMNTFRTGRPTLSVKAPDGSWNMQTIEPHDEWSARMAAKSERTYQRGVLIGLGLILVGVLVSASLAIIYGV